MREDMFKVIVERPRSGRSWARKSKLRYDKNEGRRCVTGKRLVYEHSGSVKHLNENLAPLERYLHKQVGRKWDDVFSEICQHLDTGSTVKMHVREHLDDFVMRNVKYDRSGRLFGVDRWNGVSYPSDWSADLYIDPDDKSIKKTHDLCRKLGVPTRREEWRKYYAIYKNLAPNDDIQPVSNTSFFVKLIGIWYLFELSKIPVDKNGYPINENAIFGDLSKKYWQKHDRWQVIKKVQLSHKELKKQGLTNGVTAKGGDK